MQKEFKFESVNFPEDLDVVIDFSCTDMDGSDCEVTEIAIFTNVNEEVKYTFLAEGEYARLEKQAQDIADSYACEAAQDYAEGEADRAYDAYKDRLMEDGE